MTGHRLDVDHRTLNTISLCTGNGGLDHGFGLAFPTARSVCLVEREGYAISRLVQAMEEGRLAPAPVWSNVKTFGGRAWRGAVDGVIGGIPCQAHSVAGKKLGSHDPRDLWSDARRIFVQSGAWFILIENVGGMLSAGADQVAGAERVWRDLRRLGCTVEAGLFTASETGFPQERERVFILGVHDGRFAQQADLADARCRGAERPGGAFHLLGASAPPRQQDEPDAGGSDLGHRREDLVDALGERRDEGGRHDPQGHGRGAGVLADGCREMADAGDAGLQGSQLGGPHGGQHGIASSRPVAELRRPYLVDAEGFRWRLHPRQGEEGAGTADAGGRDGSVVDPGRGGCPGRPAGALEGEEQRASAERAGGLPLVPPRPNDVDGWRDVAFIAPHALPALSRYDLLCLALGKAGVVADGDPSAGTWVDAATGRRADTAVIQAATESDLRLLVDGMEDRVDALRLAGNGVVPVVAGLAGATLAERASARSAAAAHLVLIGGFS